MSYSTPHEFVDTAYNLYLQRYDDSPSINGRIFEYLVCETLARSGITPFYYQANFAFVPNAQFDVVLYDQKYPVALTMKVSLRERYKQADLEGLALRQVYRLAKSYLVTLEDSEATQVEAKIKVGDIAGLDRCILASSQKYSELIDELSQRKFRFAKPVNPLDGDSFPEENHVPLPTDS